jgi:hypothetical protein
MRDGSGVAIENEQPRGAPLRRRLLRDEIGGKVELEIADIHARD